MTEHTDKSAGWRYRCRFFAAFADYIALSFAVPLAFAIAHIFERHIEDTFEDSAANVATAAG